MPGPLSDAVIPFIDEAVAQRNAVAGLGLLAALWSGIWWTSNLREAVSAQWALPAIRPTSLARFWHDLRVLVVLGVTLLGSISVSVLATGALDVGLAWLGLADGEVGAVVPAAAALLLGLGTGFLVFFWILTRLPRTPVPRRGVIRAALVGALGFEVLKQAVALSIGSVTGTPGGAVFGPLLGLLLFCYLVSRFALLVSAWAATARGNELPAAPSRPSPRPRPRACASYRSPSRMTVAGHRGTPACRPFPRLHPPCARVAGCPRRRAGRRHAARAWLRGPRRQRLEQQRP